MKFFYWKTETNWVKVFESMKEAEAWIPNGGAIKKKVMEEELCLVLSAGKLFALRNRCPHNGAALHRGKCTSAGEIVCPLHRYHFDLVTGRDNTNVSGSPAVVFPVSEKPDGIYVGLEKQRFRLFSFT